MGRPFLSRRAVKMFAVAILILPTIETASAQSIGEAAKRADKEKAKSSSNAYRNERLKRAEDPDREITGDNELRIVDGMWVPESKDPAKALLFPEQVKITCSNSEKTCEELKVILEPIGGLIFIDINKTIWPITSWDAHGLLSSYGPEISASGVSDRCNGHVLAMTFASGAVSTSDIPTHGKGCETFTETSSYRLVRGDYYVDTTPGNDADRPTKEGTATRVLPEGLKQEQILPITLGGFLQNGSEKEQVRGVCEPDETRNLLSCDLYNGLRGWTISKLTIAVVWPAYKNESKREYSIPITIAPLTTEHVTFRLGLQLPPDEILKFPDGTVSVSKRWHWQPVGPWDIR
jgi:hypothetical protein